MSTLRKARNGHLSQAAAAQRLGISWRTLSRWEAPDFDPETLPLTTLESMAVLYGVNLDQLIGRAPLPNHDPAA